MPRTRTVSGLTLCHLSAGHGQKLRKVLIYASVLPTCAFQSMEGDGYDVSEAVNPFWFSVQTLRELTQGSNPYPPNRFDPLDCTFKKWMQNPSMDLPLDIKATSESFAYIWRFHGRVSGCIFELNPSIKIPLMRSGSPKRNPPTHPCLPLFQSQDPTHTSAKSHLCFIQKAAPLFLSPF